MRILVSACLLGVCCRYDGQTRPDERVLSLLKEHGYRQASLAVQKANYAVRMYKNVGFKIIYENDEEFIMVCRL